MRRESKYKPLLFTTTMRNPERLKNFLFVLKKYNGKILNDKLAKKVAGEIIKRGLYAPRILSSKVKEKLKEKQPLDIKEISKILKDNPQNHKEAGFNKGWSSRFDTWFKLGKELGFVFYKNSEKIKFSKIGLKLTIDVERKNKSKILKNNFEQSAFLNAFVKYQSNNPFRRVLNENSPLILLLQVIQKLNADKDSNNIGISKLELPLLIYWKDSNAEKLYLRIKKLRKKYGFSPSWEIIFNICKEEIMEGQYIKRDHKSIIVDYPDEFIRKMRLTGLISLRGNGKFIDINKNEKNKISYILKNYSKYKKYDTEKSYFNYMATMDDKLISFTPKELPEIKKEKFLKKWVKHYSWDKIKLEILKLNKKNLTTDEFLKYLPNPTRLEFLTALAVKSKFSDVKVIPNYPIDDEGLPTSTASGNQGDIECFEKQNGILIEVTMLEGRVQTQMEIWPIERHLREFKKKRENSICYFIAPSIFSDSDSQVNWLKDQKNLIIYPKKFEEFIKLLENSKNLYIGKCP